MALPPWAAAPAEEGLGWPRGDCSLRWAMRPAIEVGVVGAGVAGVLPVPAVTWSGLGFGFGIGFGFGFGFGLGFGLGLGLDLVIGYIFGSWHHRSPRIVRPGEATLC